MTTDHLAFVSYAAVWLAFAAVYIKWFVLSPPPADTAVDQALAARPPARVGGTNYLAWLHVRLFLEQQGGRS